MVSRIAVFNGQERVGKAPQGGKGRPLNHMIETQNPEDDAEIIYIKLPRATLQACSRPNKRSLAFSHPDNIAGRKAIIYATGDNGGYCNAYEGTIIDASTNGVRQFALHGARSIRQSEWNLRELDEVVTEHRHAHHESTVDSEA